MPVQPHQPLPGLGSHIRAHGKRMDAREVNRFGYQGSDVGNAYTWPGPPGTFIIPPGWPVVKVIMSVSGNCIVFGGCQANTSAIDFDMGVSVDGGAVQNIGINTSSGFGLGANSGGMLGMAFTPSTTHTFELAVRYSAAGGPVFSIPFLVVWPI